MGVERSSLDSGTILGSDGFESCRVAVDREEADPFEPVDILAGMAIGTSPVSGASFCGENQDLIWSGTSFLMDIERKRMMSNSTIQLARFFENSVMMEIMLF